MFFWQLRNPIVRADWPIANQLLGVALGLCLPWLALLERSLLLGLVPVRRLEDFHPCASLDAAGTELGITVTDQRSECQGLQQQRREYRLKPFLYF